MSFLLLFGYQEAFHCCLVVACSNRINMISIQCHRVGEWSAGKPECGNCIVPVWGNHEYAGRNEVHIPFNRYRDITPAVGGDRLVETLLSGLGLQSVLRNLCGIPMTLGWYCAFTPIKPVTISKEQSVFVADVWSRSRNATRNKRTIIRPSQCVIGDSKN